MKKIIFLLLISILFIECNSDDTEADQNQRGNNLFAFKENELPNTNFISKIIEIDQANGNETTILEFNNNEYIESFVFNSETNEILGVGNDDKLYKINTETRTFTTINLDNSESIIYQLVIGNDNRLFAFKENELPNTNFINKVIEIDQANGNETTILEFNNNEYIESLVFNSETNEILGVGNDDKLYKINTETRTFTTINLDNSESIIYQLVIGNDNRLFAFKENELPNTNFINKVIEIDQVNGNETTILEFSNNEHVESLVFNSETNEILGVGNDDKLYKINTETRTFTTINLDNSESIIYQLVIK